MGLSSSQARLLTLTSRQHEIEYKAQKLQAQKLQLANDSDKVYQDYLNKLDAKKIQYRVVNNDGSMYFADGNFNDLTAAGYLYNVNGTICNNLNQVKNALTEQGITNTNLTANDTNALLTTLIQEGYVVLMEVSDSADPDYYYSCDTSTTPPTSTIKSQENDSVVVTINGQPLSEEANKILFSVFGNTSVSTSTSIQEVSDEKELKKAEAQYEADMSKINSKDSRYDTELSQLETERNAIKNQIETLQTVANDNVDRTFKLFT